MTKAPLPLQPPLDETAADIETALQSLLDAERPTP
jgi:hypothetical protein